MTDLLGHDDVGGRVHRLDDASLPVAVAALGLFLVAIIAALAVTLTSVPAHVGYLAASAVTPIIVLSLIFLFFEYRRRPWSFAAAAALGILGVSLRLIVNAQPQLEVGGGLPLWVTVTYVTLGAVLVATSLWAFASLRNVHRQKSRESSPVVQPPPA
jgi:FlaA1/EpsC-like NDP-sugar epimerase